MTQSTDTHTRQSANTFMNRLMLSLLRSPLHFFASRWVMLITVTGRKSGKTYTIPVQYQREADTVRFVSHRHRRWVTNLKGGAPVTLHLRGQEIVGTATLCEDDARCREGVKRLYPRTKDALLDRLVLVEVQLTA